MATGVTASWKPICLGVGWPEPASAAAESRPVPKAGKSPARMPLPRRRPIMRIAPKFLVPASCENRAERLRQTHLQGRLQVILATSPRGSQYVGFSSAKSRSRNRSPLHQARAPTGTQGRLAAAFPRAKVEGGGTKGSTCRRHSRSRSGNGNPTRNPDVGRSAGFALRALPGGHDNQPCTAQFGRIHERDPTWQGRNANATRLTLDTCETASPGKGSQGWSSSIFVKGSPGPSLACGGRASD